MTEKPEGPDTDPIRTVVDRRAARVPPVSGDRLVHAAIVHRSRRARRRRRRVRFVVTTTSAAAIVALVAVVATQIGGPTSQTTRSGSMRATRSQSVTAAAPPGNVTVRPVTGLHDGQRVMVRVSGFDAGTEVTLLECVEGARVFFGSPAVAAPKWVCRAPVRATSQQIGDTPAAPPGTGDPTQATASLLVSSSGHGFSTWVESNGSVSTPAKSLADATHASCGSTAAVQHSEPPTTPGPCRVVTIGSYRGTTRVFVSAPLSFSATEPPPTTSPEGAPDGSPTPRAPTTTPTTGAGVTPALCPATPPELSRRDAVTGPVFDFVPTAITVCHYPVGGPEDGPSKSPHPVLVTDPGTISRILRDARLLSPVPARNEQCTAEMGRTMVLTAVRGDQLSTVTAHLYGCGLVGNGTTMRQGAQSLAWIFDLD